MGNLIDLTKKSGIVLEKNGLADVIANIKVATDVSGSMWGRFQNGTVQEVLDRLLGIGMNMDANKSIEVFAFNTASKYIGTVNEKNHADFVKKVFMKKTAIDGGTNYAPVMHAILESSGCPVKPIKVQEVVEKKGFFNKLFGKTEVIEKDAEIERLPLDHPTFVFFITDGANWDRAEAEHVIREAAKVGVFWQFVGIGNESFPFLEKLDNLQGRYVDNADFFPVEDIMALSDEKLYELLLKEFPSWLKEAKAKNLIK